MQGFRSIHVIQGEHAVSEAEDVVMLTVLGSCVCACLYDPVRRVGGMNHFLLPEGRNRGDIRHASAAMEQLVNGLLKSGAARERLRAKLFGGARMLAGLPDIGLRNGEAAQAFLNGERIPCEAADLGGARARRVRFWPASGRAQMLLLDRTDPVVAQQRPKPLASASIELF